MHLLQVSNIQVPLVLGKDIVDASESPLVLVMDDVTLTLHSHVSAVTVFRTLDSHLRYGCPVSATQPTIRTRVAAWSFLARNGTAVVVSAPMIRCHRRLGDHGLLSCIVRNSKCTSKFDRLARPLALYEPVSELSAQY